MLNSRSIKKLFLSGLLFLSACSSSDTVNTSAPIDTSVPLRIRSLDLYISRASFSHADFEQFKFLDDKLFAECGKIAGGRQAVRYQNLSRLKPEEIAELKKYSENIIEFNSKHELNLDEAGSSRTMFDPGQFNLKILSTQGNTDIKTSLDSVTGATKTSEDNLKKLAVALRDISIRYSPSSNLCGNRKFHDLG